MPCLRWRGDPALAPEPAHRRSPRRLRERRRAALLARRPPAGPGGRRPLAGVAEADLCIVGGGFTGLWAALQAKAGDPARERRRCSRRETLRHGRQRPQRRLPPVLASPTASPTAWRASPTRSSTLERLGLENFAGLRADLAAHGIDCELRGDRRAHGRARAPRDRRHARRTPSCCAASATTSSCSMARADAGRGGARPPTSAALWDRTGAALVHPGKLAARPAATPRCGAGVRVYEHSAGDRPRERAGAGVRRARPPAASVARRARPARHQRLPAAAARAPPLRRPGLRLRAGDRAAHATRQRRRSAGAGARASATPATSSTTTG